MVPATPDKDTSRELLAEKLEDDEPDGIFTFKRKPHVKYHHVSAWVGVHIPYFFLLKSVEEIAPYINVMIICKMLTSYIKIGSYVIFGKLRYH